MSNVATTSRELSSYLEAYTDFTKRAPGQKEGWLRKLREDAFARFCEVGFPTTHDEDWRFTNVSAIAQTAFQLPESAGETPAGQPAGRRRYEVGAEQIEPYRIAGAACQLVFVNGKFAAELSSTNSLPKGVSAGSLAEEIRRDPKPLEKHLGRYLNSQRDVFCALNTAFLEDGAYVHIGRGTVLEAPIYLLFVTTTSGSPLMTHPRNLITAEENSQATFVEDYVSLDGGVAFSNAATELIAGEHTVLSHYLIEREHTDAYNVSTLRLQQNRGANVASHSVLLGGGLVRNNVHPVLAGEGADCLINGLFIGNGRQHMDNYMLVEHASPHCGSRQFYNGILDGHSRGVFHGRIIVHKDAQKTDAKQTNRNLLLSDDAQIDTKPQLEIYADDVKCTHGATIGQIEEDELFYLRSRGLNEAAARRLLLFAFASECLERMKPGPVRTRIEGLVNEWLFNIKPGNPEDGKGASPRAMHWEEVG